MKTNKTIALIHPADPGKYFHLDSMSIHNGYQIGKVLIADQSSWDAHKHQYPGAQFVSDKNDIIHDEGTDLVLISSAIEDHLDIVRELIQAGKPVRVI